MAMGSALLRVAVGQSSVADIKLGIAPYTLEASPKRHFQTVAYNGQVPGPLLRMRQGQEQIVEIRNLTNTPEVVHWHGLFLPSEIDGAMEEGTPMIGPGATTQYAFRPDPPGFRWFHTHTFAGKDLTKAQYGGLHGFLMIEPRENSERYDARSFLDFMIGVVTSRAAMTDT
jgi:FtsP/CotA-like multicopper oxidase with cupredoxin domain